MCWILLVVHAVWAVGKSSTPYKANLVEKRNYYLLEFAILRNYKDLIFPQSSSSFPKCHSDDEFDLFTTPMGIIYWCFEDQIFSHSKNEIIRKSLEFALTWGHF